MWILFALSGPVLWAVSTHIDKYLIERFFKDSDTAVLMVFTAVMGLVMLPFIWYWQRRVTAIALSDIAVMTASGILYMGAMLFYLRAIQSEEASVVAPLFQASTLFTLLLAYLFLGETLSWRDAAGVVLVFGGALLLSFDRSFRAAHLNLRLVALMLAATFVVALSSVIFKYFAVHDAFWITTFWINVGQALFGLGIVAVPHYRRQFAALLKRSPGPVMAVNGANELINLGGTLGVRYASLLAPLAVVSVISSTTTLFVFAFGILLTVFAPGLGREDVSRPVLLRKGLSAALVATGVALIEMSGHGR